MIKRNLGVHIFVGLVCLLGLQRVIFFLHFLPFTDFKKYGLQVLAKGILFDGTVAAFYSFAVLFLYAFFPKNFRRLCLFGLFFNGLFLLFSEFYFFEEYRARFNYFAIDYLYYPREVIEFVWANYPILKLSILFAFLAIGVIWLLERFFQQGTKKERIQSFLKNGTISLLALGSGSWGLNINSMNVTPNREVNELSGNGYFTLGYALRTNEVDFPKFYRTISSGRAQKITEEMRGASAPVALIDGPHTKAPFNVVLIMCESFSADYTGVHHSTWNKNLTPNFDKLARAGIHFPNFHSTGTRTVRGLEGIWASYPPVPGDALLHRPKIQNIQTIARVLKDAGLTTTFVYGGFATFDGMERFASANGFEQIIDRRHIEKPSFVNEWGVADEDIFRAAMQSMDKEYQRGKKFFTSVLTVSNHKPYTFPEGRLSDQWNPNQKMRFNAVRYMDWSIGKFVDELKTKPYFDNTLVVVVGDHGARVYGDELIPILSYEVAFAIYGPKILKERSGTTQDVLCSSIDVTPTILDILGLSYRSVFFGTSCLKKNKQTAFAPVQYDREIGILWSDRLSLLGPMKQALEYAYDPKTRALTRKDIDPVYLEKTIAIYQKAFEMYQNESFNVEKNENKSIAP